MCLVREGGLREALGEQSQRVGVGGGPRSWEPWFFLGSGYWGGWAQLAAESYW